MRSRDWNETFVTDISDSDDSAIVIPSRRLDFDEQSVLGYVCVLCCFRTVK